MTEPKAERPTLGPPLLAYFESIGAPEGIRNALVNFAIAWQWMRESKEGEWFLTAYEEDGSVGPPFGPSRDLKAFEILRRAEEIIELTMDEIDNFDVDEIMAGGMLDEPGTPHEEVMQSLGLPGEEGVSRIDSLIPRVAVVGTRPPNMQATSEQRNEYEWIVSNVRSFFSAIPVDQDFMLISGGAEGVDSLAQAFGLVVDDLQARLQALRFEASPARAQQAHRRHGRVRSRVAVVLESRDVAHRRAREGRRQAGVRSRDAGREVDVSYTRRENQAKESK